MLGVLYSTLGKACNRMLVGKTIWKSLGLPTFMYGSDVIIYGANGIGQLQSLDNQAYRHILKVPKYTAACGLRAEVGASSAMSRDMKTKLMYLKHATGENCNKLLKGIVLGDLREGRSSWARTVAGYLEKIDCDVVQLEVMSEVGLTFTMT